MKESMNKEQERKRIGGKIADLRKARGMTQQQLADMAGLAQQNLARVETGRYSSRLDTLAAIADALGCQIDFIIKDGE
jgi:transcriptional regulator with XRE-family HTH domain